MSLPIKSGHSFEHFFAGRHMGTHLTRDGGEELLDALRLLLEECDRVASVNTLTDLDDGFGGLAVQVLEYFRDEVHGALLVSVRYDSFMMSYSYVLMHFISARVGFPRGARQRWGQG